MKIIGIVRKKKILTFNVVLIIRDEIFLLYRHFQIYSIALNLHLNEITFII